MTVNHRNQGKSPSIKVYECIQNFYEYLHKVDPMATINPLYNEEEEDGHKFVLITEPSLFPSNMLGLHNHIQICNLYTMSLANRNNDEGNPKLHRLTYVVLWVTTKYAFDHIVGLIQSYLIEMNMFVKEKKMPNLNTRTCLAIIGTTADWCPVSLQTTLHKDLEHHVENLQTSGRVDTKFCHHGVPAFLLRKNKMRMPKMNSLMSKQDVEFIDYYERLHQCIVFELADEDWDWFKLRINDYVVDGHLKRVVSHQASILELPHGLQSNFMMAHFLKSIKLQMLYAHYFRTISCNRVQSLAYMISVEVEQGEVRPYKNTNLRWEVLAIRLPPTHAGGQVLVNTFIDGAHMVLMGPARRQLRLLYQNSEVNEQFVSYFAKCLCAHMYQYLCKEKHFTRKCCQAILGSWFEAKEGLRAMDSSWDSATYRATPLWCLPHQAYVQDMAKLGVVDIAPELLQEMSDQLKHKPQFNTEAMQKVADHMNLKPCEGVQFSQVNSMALALMVNTHTTDGNQSLCPSTSMQVELDLGRAREEFHMLAVHLLELAPDHAIFEEPVFSNKAMDDLVSLGSRKPQKIQGLYKETRNNSIHLRVCINKIEQSALVAVQNSSTPPQNSGSAAPSPPVVQLSQTGGMSGVVQGS
jgi:hypothetical protein